jgi:ribosomal protein S16
MPVRVRLTRVGSKKNPIWRVVVADGRSPRDGRFIETIGHYNPQTEPSTILIDEDRLQHWRAAERHGKAADEGARQERRRLRGLLAVAVEDLLEYLARALVDEPDRVEVEGFDEDDGTIVLELHVAEADAGKVIGRGGRTVAALRTVMKAVATRDGQRVLVDVVD